MPVAGPVAGRAPEEFLKGAASNDSGATTPDSAAIDLLADITVKVKIIYRGTTTALDIAGHWPSGDKKWYMQINTGDRVIFGISDGTENNVTSVAQIATQGYSTGDIMHIKVKVKVDTSDLWFFLSPNGVDWTQLGIKVNTGDTSFQSIAAPLVVGNDSGTTTQAEVYYFELYSGIDGAESLIASFYAKDNQIVDDTTAFKSRGTGEQWTPRGSSAFTSH